MASGEVSVIALVENLELEVPHRLPVRLLHHHQEQQQQQTIRPVTTTTPAAAAVAKVAELDGQESKMALKRELSIRPDGDDAIG